jgi:hypothetical protein
MVNMCISRADGDLKFTKVGGIKMESAINKRNYWIVLVVAAILAIGVTLIQQKWLPDYDFAAFLVDFIILGIAFYWVYSIDRQGLWWAQIPALVMVALLATGIVAYFTPKDASGSSPYGVITLGIGAAVIGLVLKRPTVKLVFYIIAIITLLVGTLMLAVDPIWKILLYIVEVLLIGYLIWQTTRQLAKK